MAGDFVRFIAGVDEEKDADEKREADNAADGNDQNLTGGQANEKGEEQGGVQKKPRKWIAGHCMRII